MKDEEGYVFIDRNGKLFSDILEWLRTTSVPTFSREKTEALRQEAVYYGLSALVAELEARLASLPENALDAYEFGQLLKGRYFGKKDFRGLALRGVELNKRMERQLVLNECNMSKMDLGDCAFGFRCLLFEANLSGADLSGARLPSAVFDEANLAHARCRGTDLSDAHFAKADLTGVDLTSADIVSAAFLGAKLVGARLCGADFQYARFCDSDMTGADMTGAYNSGDPRLNAHADFSGAILRGANLTRADFTFTKGVPADLTGANITDAKLPASWLALLQKTNG